MLYDILPTTSVSTYKMFGILIRGILFGKQWSLILHA